MKISVRVSSPEPRKIRRAVEVLESGGVIAYPTDTVYGLGCDILQKKAVDALYRIKGMKPDHPVAFVCPDLSDIARYAMVHNTSYRIMRHLLPGPYCFILPATREVPRVLMMKRRTVGIRVPKHDVVQALVRELGRPIVSSSATWDDQVLNEPDDIEARFRALDLVLDAGPGGLEPSTVVDLTGPEPVVVREGAGPIDDLV
jgi:tRNA threonylcarbamoyl adenosine modification protein (Sua5/YciO/YrdC/YwlC family)